MTETLRLNKADVRIFKEPGNSFLPIAVEERIRAFLVDKRTGNVQLNIKDGRILGLRIEEIVSL